MAEETSRSSWVKALVLIIVIAGTGYFLWQRFVYSPPFPKTPAGVVFEDLIPKDANFVLRFSPTDDQESSRFQKIWKNVFKDKEDAVIPFLISEITKGSKNSLPLEVIPGLFSHNTSFALGISVESEIFHFFFQHPSPDVALKNLAPLGEGKLRIGKIKDVVYITNDKTNASKGSFSRSKFFKEAANRIQKPFSGYAFLRMPGSLSIFKDRDFHDTKSFFDERGSGKLRRVPHEAHAAFASPSETKEGGRVRAQRGELVGETLVSTRKDNIFPVSTVTFRANEGGLDFDLFSLGDKKALKDSPLASLAQPFSPTLFSKISTEKALVFAESHNLGDILSVQLKKWQAAFGANQKLDSSFATEYLPIFQKAYAFAMQDSSKILPSFSLYVDASGAPDKAKNLIEKLNEQLLIGISYVNLAIPMPDKLPVAEEKKFEKMPGRTAILHLNKIPEETAKIPLFQIMEEPLEISYGLMPSNILFFSTRPNFEQTMTVGEEISPLFRSIDSLGMVPGNIFLVDGDGIGKYANRTVSLLKEEKKFSEQDEKTFNILKQYLAPFRSYLQVSQGDSRNINGKAFLKIQRE